MMVDAIAAVGLQKRFGMVSALNGVSFSVRTGEIFGCLGPNGAGKTTLVRILLGLLRPTGGCSQVLGRDVARDAGEIRKRIGVVLENHGLYERLSAYDNLEYYGRLHIGSRSSRSTRLRELLVRTGLWERRSDLVGTFSRGMKQKLAFARSLIPEPDVLFLDEPTSGLDPSSQRSMQDLMVRSAQEGGTTIFLTTHNLTEAQRICSRVAVLHGGEMIACGRPETMMRDSAVPAIEIVFENGGRDSTDQITADVMSLPFVTACRWGAERLTVTLSEPGSTSELLSLLVQKDHLFSEAKRVTKSLEEVYLALVKESDL